MGSFSISTNTLKGISPILTQVETDISRGLPKFSIVGMTDRAVQEAKERVKSAIINSQFEFPRTRIVVNLAPANLTKQGTSYDLAIAMSILGASGALTHCQHVKEYLYCAELSLNGTLLPVPGAILAATLAAKSGCSGIIVAPENANQAALQQDIPVYAPHSLQDLISQLEGNQLQEHFRTTSTSQSRQSYADFSDIAEQEHAKRALTIAAAGHHNVLMSGPPGCGKSLLASALPGILPPLHHSEALTVTKIYSLNHATIDHLISERPFRSPHHSASSIALIGGGSNPLPGEVSLAHHGVLFLDEFPEFERRSLEYLRQPLEHHEVHISRSAGRVTYPANFMLVAAMNPCPCGYRNDPYIPCTCLPSAITRYQRKISGPLMDRIDLRVSMHPTPLHCIGASMKSAPSVQIRKCVMRARSTQQVRQGKPNCALSITELHQQHHLSPAIRALAQDIATKHHLSARAYTRILRVARTIADLATSSKIKASHIREALQFHTISLNV